MTTAIVASFGSDLAAGRNCLTILCPVHAVSCGTINKFNTNDQINPHCIAIMSKQILFAAVYVAVSTISIGSIKAQTSGDPLQKVSPQRGSPRDISSGAVSPSAGATLFAGTGVRPSIDSPYAQGQPEGVATAVALGNPFGVEISGDVVWLTTVDDHCLWKTNLVGGPIVRFAGTGVEGYSGDGGPAIQATFRFPHEVRVDQYRNLYIADTRNHVIRRIDGATGVVTTLAGNGSPGFAGDRSSGTQVQFKQPHSVVLDNQGGLLVADTQNHRLRRIDLKSGIVETISGTGERKMPTDGAKAKGAPLFGPRSLAVDSESIWIALREGNSIWRIDRHSKTLHHVAGSGKKGYSGDGGPPLEATFNGPKGLVLDSQNRLLVVDTENQAIRRIDLQANLIETVMGGTLAKSTTTLKRPHGISFHRDRGFFVADSENHRVLIGD